MTNSAAVEFYSAIRRDPALIAHLASATSEESLIERIKDEGAKRGIVLSDIDVRRGFDHLDEVVHQAAGEGELTEKELEIVSGGTSFSAFVLYSHNTETNGDKWGKIVTHPDGGVYYYNNSGCRTDKDTFLKMNR